MDLNANDILHITIGASTTGKVDLTHDLRLIKAAMLYADKVKLISLTSSMLISVLPMFSLTEDQTIDFLVETLPTINREQSPQILSLFQMYRQLKKRNIALHKSLFV